MPSVPRKGKVHQLDTLGVGDRRVLVSRGWSGKTLADHRWDQAAWVRKVQSIELGHTDPRYQTRDEQIDAAWEGRAPDRVRWERAKPNDPDVPELPSRLLRAIATRMKQKAALRAATALAPPGTDFSANGLEESPIRRDER